MLDSLVVPAQLVEMIFSIDGTVGYGDTNLIVPDAILMKSKILFIKGQGPVLEWGVRSRKKEYEKTTAYKNDPKIDNEDRLREREYYVEVTLHLKI